ncbi:MAG: hypothetical protein J07HX5_00352 [halophilic archaeon J07HX5]|nr:MAG: hypothetical protein J07HX5_00352 [halophilic archaeon J07HX5]
MLTAALPATDPRLDAPSVGGGDDSVSGGWDSIHTVFNSNAQSESELDPEQDNDDHDRSSPDSDGLTLSVERPLEAGGETVVTVHDESIFSSAEHEILVDGEPVGVTSDGERNVSVPYTKEMTIGLSDEPLSKTFDVQTDGSISLDKPVAQNRNVSFSLTVGTTPLPDTRVTMNGQSVGVTDDKGRVSARMPERVGSVELVAERGPVTANTTVDLPPPEVIVTSPVVLPGLPAPVSVTADGVGVPNVTVSAAGAATARPTRTAARALCYRSTAKPQS